MKKKYLVTMLLLYALTTNLACAYPPDNAAVLYLKNMEFFTQPDETLWDQICNLPTSSEQPSQELREFIEKNRNLVHELQIASQLEHCDWGLDFSQGYEMLMPGLPQMKNFHYLLLANSAIHLSDGDISSALQGNLAVRRLAYHISNDTMIGFLVSLGIDRNSNKALTHLLSTCPVTEQTLAELKNELLSEVYQPKSFRHPLTMEKEVALHEISIMTPERYMKVLKGISPVKEDHNRTLEYLDNINVASRERAASILSRYYDDVVIALEKPYKETYEAVSAMSDKISSSAATDPDYLLPAVFLPAFSKCYSLSTNWNTNHDAMLTALDVYIVFAGTGELPSQLPSSTYVDHYSGKPFLYEVTDDGFILRCRQEDLSDKEVHEYTFKLPRQKL